MGACGSQRLAPPRRPPHPAGRGVGAARQARPAARALPRPRPRPVHAHRRGRRAARVRLRPRTCARAGWLAGWCWVRGLAWCGLTPRHGCLAGWRSLILAGSSAGACRRTRLTPPPVGLCTPCPQCWTRWRGRRAAPQTAAWARRARPRGRATRRSRTRCRARGRWGPPRTSPPSRSSTPTFPRSSSSSSSSSKQRRRKPHSSSSSSSSSLRRRGAAAGRCCAA